MTKKFVFVLLENGKAVNPRTNLLAALNALKAKRKEHRESYSNVRMKMIRDGHYTYVADQGDYIFQILKRDLLTK